MVHLAFFREASLKFWALAFNLSKLGMPVVGIASMATFMVSMMVIELVPEVVIVEEDLVVD